MVGRLSWLIAGVMVAGMLAGCGGGSKSPVSPQNPLAVPSSLSGFGTVILTVNWPSKGTRVIPYATEKIVVRLKRNGMTHFEQVIDRSQNQVRFEKVPVGNWTMEAEARASGEQVVRAKGIVLSQTQPVAGAQVTWQVDFPQPATYTAVTDSEGKFDFGLVAVGSQGELRVVAAGYQEWRSFVGGWEFMQRPEGLVVILSESQPPPPQPPFSRKRQEIPPVIVAAGAVSFELAANEQKQVVVELASKLSDLRVTPSPVTVQVGESVDVAVQGLVEQALEWDPNRVWLFLVSLDPEKVRWEISDSAIASLNATSGVSVSLRGLHEGQTTLTVTDTESGKSKQVRVQVSSENPIAIAKSIVQMLRDFGVSVVNLPETEVITLQAALAEQQQVISNEVQIAQEFSKRINFPTRVLGLDSEDTLRNEGSPNNLIGKEPGQYREVQTPSGRVLDRIGNAPDDKTWIVTSALPETNGMQLTVTVQNPIGIFRYTHEAGRYTFQVRKPDDANLQYDGSIAVTVDSQGNPTQVALSATVKDSALKTPITFSGTLQGTPSTTRKPRSRQSSGSSITPYKEAKFVNVTLQSQYGSASIGELKVVWLNDSLEPDKLQQISLTNLQATSQTSKPASLVINTATVELQPTTQQEKQQYREDLKPKTATFSATIEGSGVRLQVSNMQASDFVFVKVGERWNWWTWTTEPVYRPVPRSLTGQVSYSSPTLTFSGSVSLTLENEEASGFGSVMEPVSLEQVPKGTFTLQGNWTPNIGKPAGINLQMTSNPQGNAPHVTIQLTLNYGDQKLSGTITGTLDIRDGQSYGFKAGSLEMTHTPSNFVVQVSGQSGAEGAGVIKKADGTKVADIGKAKNLGLPDLGGTWVVKYADGTFETLESVLPRSRVSRR